jgi:hypothetical protein
MKKKHKHLLCGIVHGKDVIIRADILDGYCLATARLYYVGLGDIPEANIKAVRLSFFPYCCACGAKVL